MPNSKPDRSEATATRRTFVLLAGAALGTVGGGVERASAQPRITMPAVIPELGAAWEGNYVGQYVLVTDPTPRSDASPSWLDQCEFETWPSDRTEAYQALVLDKITDQPQGVTVPLFVDGERPALDAGNAFIINRTHSCPQGHVGIELEEVPVETSGAPVTAGPTVTTTGGGAQNGAGDPGAIPGQPGFGPAAALLGLGGAALLRYLRRDE